MVRWNTSIYNFVRSSWRSSTLNKGLGWRDKIHDIKQQTHPTVDDIKLNKKMWGSEWLYKNLSALVIISQPYSAIKNPKKIIPVYIDKL